MNDSQNTQTPVNDSATSGHLRAPVTQSCSADVRRDLIALRLKHGAESAVGHRCSNVDEALQRLEHETDPRARAVIIAGIQKATAEIAELLAAAA